MVDFDKIVCSTAWSSEVETWRRVAYRQVKVVPFLVPEGSIDYVIVCLVGKTEMTTRLGDLFEDAARFAVARALGEPILSNGRPEADPEIGDVHFNLMERMMLEIEGSVARINAFAERRIRRFAGEAGKQGLSHLLLERVLMSYESLTAESLVEIFETVRVKRVMER